MTVTPSRAARRRRSSHLVLVAATGCVLSHGGVAVPVANAEPAAPVIRTVAGGGGGDGGAATDATVIAPVRVAVVSSGLLVAERASYRVRLVDGRGLIRPFAGIGASGFGGDGGRAVRATLSAVSGIAAAADGAVYVADRENGRVRAIDPQGTISTFAGSGPRSDGEPPQFIGDGGPARNAYLDEPGDVATAADGTVYVSEPGVFRLRRIAPNGTIATVLGPDGAAEQPIQTSALAVGRSGEVYVADTAGHRVWRVSATGEVTPFAGTGEEGAAGDGGAATAALLNEPSGLAVDRTGAVLIADTGNHRIRRVAGGTITTVAGTAPASCEPASACAPGYGGDGGPATAARLASPAGVAADAAGNIYVADTGNNRVRRVAPDGKISTVAGNGTTFAGDGAPARSAGLGSPAGLAVDANGTVYVADAEHHRVRAVRNDIIETVAGSGATSCTTGDDGTTLCTGTYGGDNGAASSAGLNAPTGVAVTPTGELYIADTGNNVVRKVAANGTITTIAGNRANGADGTCPDALAKELAAEAGAATAACLAQPRGLALDSSGNLYIADTGNRRICKVSPDGTLTTVAGGAVAGAVPGGAGAPVPLARVTVFAVPTAVAVAAEGAVLVADTSQSRILSIDANGVVTPLAGTGAVGDSGDGGPAAAATLSEPTALVVGSDGSVYVADTGNNRVRRIARDGTISAFAGGGTPSATSFYGDGGPPTEAALSKPSGLAVRGTDVFVSDSGNRRIRGVVPPPAPTRVTLDVAPATTTAGDAVTVTGTLVRGDTGAAIASARVRVTAAPGSAPDAIRTTDESGRFTLTATPSATTVFSADFDETTAYAPSTATAGLLVRHRVTVTSPAGSKTSASSRSTTTVKGRVVPAGAVAVEVVEVRATGQSVVAAVRSASDGQFTLKVKLPRGTYTLRVRVPATAANAAGESRSWTHTVT